MVRRDHVLALGYNGITIERTFAPSSAAQVAPDCVRRMRSSQQLLLKMFVTSTVTKMGNGAEARSEDKEKDEACKAIARGFA